MFRTRKSERGAAAVEFALIVPVLILLIVGMLEFSRAYNAQLSLTNAAREGARVMAVHDSASLARTAAIGAAVSLNPALTAGDITVTPSTCSSTGTVKVTIEYDLELMTGFFGATIPLTGIGVMLCGG